MDPELESRVRKSISIFNDNIKKTADLDLEEREAKVVELAKMYKDDTESFLEKGDLVTAFSSIEYAHGLLDAILKINGLDDD